MSEERGFAPQRPAAAREEVLEELWTSQEAGALLTLGALGETIHAGPGDGWGGVTQELVELGWVQLDDDGHLCLTETGKDEAREAVRRHRLAEVLFHQVFELPMDTTESEACRIEHELSPQVTEAVCSFLGHPPVCPHGRPIPPGACCALLSRRVPSLICRLIDLTPGERGPGGLDGPAPPRPTRPARGSRRDAGRRAHPAPAKALAGRGGWTGRSWLSRTRSPTGSTLRPLVEW